VLPDCATLCWSYYTEWVFDPLDKYYIFTFIHFAILYKYETCFGKGVWRFSDTEPHIPWPHFWGGLDSRNLHSRKTTPMRAAGDAGVEQRGRWLDLRPIWRSRLSDLRRSPLLYAFCSRPSLRGPQHARHGLYGAPPRHLGLYVRISCCGWERERPTSTWCRQATQPVIHSSILCANDPLLRAQHQKRSVVVRGIYALIIIIVIIVYYAKRQPQYKNTYTHVQIKNVKYSQSSN